MLGKGNDNEKSIKCKVGEAKGQGMHMYGGIVDMLSGRCRELHVVGNEPNMPSVSSTFVTSGQKFS